MLLSSYQFNDTTYAVDHYLDQRQFGNVSEEQLSTSALSYIATPTRLLHGNGVLRGFDLETTTASGEPNPNGAQIYLTGGNALVNGSFIQLDNQTVTIPLVQEQYPFPGGPLLNVNWVLCVNDKGQYQPIILLDYDSTLGTPNDPTRLANLVNVQTSSIYQAEGTTFSNLVNFRKDLCPLYIVSSTVVTPANTISLSLTDARRYVNDVDNNLPLRLTSAESQGNFKSPVSIFNWLKYNSGFNGTAIVKGANSTSGTIGTNLTLSSCTIDGQGDATLTMNGQITLGSNLTIQNLNIIFNGGINAVANA